MAAFEFYNSVLFRNDANLVAYYRMEGNANDSKGTYNGTGTNIGYGETYGKFGQGVRTTATTGESGINFGNGSNLNFTSGNATWMFWMYPVATSTNTVFLCRGAYQVDGWYMNFDASARPCFVSSQSGAGQVVNSSTVLTSTWYHLAYTKSGTTVRIYVNGSETGYTGSQTITNPASSTRNFYAFRYDTTGYVLNGYLDDIIIFNRALTGTEIGQIYAGTNGYYRTQSFSDSLTLSDAKSYLFTKALTDGLALSDVPSKKIIKPTTDLFTLSDVSNPTMYGIFSRVPTILSAIKNNTLGYSKGIKTIGEASPSAPKGTSDASAPAGATTPSKGDIV